MTTEKNQIDLPQITSHLRDKLEKIKVVLFDVDGVLTDGHLFWGGEDVGWARLFHACDGYGLKLLQKEGFKVGVITAGNSKSIHKRFIEDLKLDYVFSGDENKLKAYETILDDGYRDEELFYMGDELLDLPLLKRVGLSATVSHACWQVKEAVNYVAVRPPGQACARELMDIILYYSKSKK